MTLIRDALTPTVLSNIIAQPKKTSMLQPQFGGSQNSQDPNQQQSTLDPNNQGQDQPSTKDYIIAGLQKMASRPAPPELTPGSRVRNADTTLTQPDNFKSFYDMLGSISQRGQSMTAAAEAKAAYARAQQAANISGQYGGGGGSSGAPYKGAVGKGVEQWRNTTLQVMRELGIPDQYVGDILRRMNQESGGNPNIVNNWDSNAKAGHPSQGLMQTIPSTFAGNAGKYASRGIFDPYANIYAGLMYAGNRYGKAHGGFLGGVLYAMNKPGGY
jgi:hypothetical protein